jgi:hypothetical protein
MMPAACMLASDLRRSKYLFLRYTMAFWTSLSEHPLLISHWMHVMVERTGFEGMV